MSTEELDYTSTEEYSSDTDGEWQEGKKRRAVKRYKKKKSSEESSSTTSSDSWSSDAD